MDPFSDVQLIFGSFALVQGQSFWVWTSLSAFLSLLSQMLMSVKGNPVLMLILAKILLVDITVTAFQDGKE